MSDLGLIEIDVVPIPEREAGHKHETGFEEDIDWSDDFLHSDMTKISSALSARPAEIFEQACQMAAMNAVSNLSETFSSFLRLCESEIEKIFLAALIAESQQNDEISLPHKEYWKDNVTGFVKGQIDDFMSLMISKSGPTPITALMQVPIGGYRVDFLLYGISAHSDDRSNWLRVALIVECDGHDFHEKTKAQAKRDKKRDRDLVARGFTVMRFTGSEIWRDPRACIREAISFIRERQSDHQLNWFPGVSS